MEKENDKTVKPAPAASTPCADAAEGWNPYDYYDCRLDADTPKPTAEYIANVMPWAKEAIAKRQAAQLAAVTEKVDPKKV